MSTSSRNLAFLLAASLLAAARPAVAADPEASPPPADSTAPAQPEPPPPAAPAGQWAYTSQYGWLWMPYADVYTHVPPDGWGTPYQYVWEPAFGWTWVAAPWVWGVGPWPFFGVIGPIHFGWWGHGWWRSPWRWHFAPAPMRRPGFVRGPPGFFHAPPARSVPFRSGPAPGMGAMAHGRR